MTSANFSHKTRHKTRKFTHITFTILSQDFFYHSTNKAEHLEHWYRMQIIEGNSPHECIAAIILQYQNNEKNLQPGIRRTLNHMLTEIYPHMNRREDTCIDIFICDTEDQAPSWFRYKPSGKGEMIINISYDGGKEITFRKISWWQKFRRVVGENWRPVCSCLKDILPAVLSFITTMVTLLAKV
ncbi:uncharacterized protein [Mytilus edulis]|uniref:uncharacterized protein n=1 Tax=Mytilus edulis TaxID=6550 RepID=UPI0039F08EF4